MRTIELIREIQRLPLQKRMYVVEKALHSIREQENSIQMQKAADILLHDYTSDKELTAFTDIDFERFYETR